MNAALVASGLLLGLAGGPHCAVMCGALQAGVARSGGGDARAVMRAAVSLQLGRLVGYSVAGAAVAASAAAFESLGAAASVLRPVWSMLHVGALVFGLCLVSTGRVPAWVSSIGRRSVKAPALAPIRFLERFPSSARAAGVGACWAVMPCGLLQSALIVSALASGAPQGAAVMAAFTVGTTLSLFGANVAWRKFGGSRLLGSRPTLAVRLAGALLAGASSVALYHGLGDAIGALCA
jgi:sulfite exporter TauE/SafE